MSGIRHLVNYICRGRRKSLFLLLGTIGAICFILGRSSQIFGGDRARDLSVQDAHVVVPAGRPEAPGVAPVFPDPVGRNRIIGADGDKLGKIVDNKSNVGHVTTKSVGYVSGKYVMI